jgi:hypothetical protein
MRRFVSKVVMDHFVTRATATIIQETVRVIVPSEMPRLAA